MDIIEESIFFIEESMNMEIILQLTRVYLLSHWNID